MSNVSHIDFRVNFESERHNLKLMDGQIIPIQASKLSFDIMYPISGGFASRIPLLVYDPIGVVVDVINEQGTTILEEIVSDTPARSVTRALLRSAETYEVPFAKIFAAVAAEVLKQNKRTYGFFLSHVDAFNVVQEIEGNEKSNYLKAIAKPIDYFKLLVPEYTEIRSRNNPNAFSEAGALLRASHIVSIMQSNQSTDSQAGIATILTVPSQEGFRKEVATLGEKAAPCIDKIIELYCKTPSRSNPVWGIGILQKG